mgnify:CR=1 FL=1
MKTVRLYLVLFFLKMGVGYTQTPTIKPIFNDFDSPHFLFEKFTIGNKKVSKLEKVYSNGELLYSIKSTFKFDLKGRIVNKVVEDKEKIVKSKFTYFENDLWKTRTKKTNYKEVILNLDGL